MNSIHTSQSRILGPANFGQNNSRSSKVSELSKFFFLEDITHQNPQPPGVRSIQNPEGLS